MNRTDSWLERLDHAAESAGWSREAMAGAYPSTWASVAADAYAERLTTLLGRVDMLVNEIGQARRLAALLGDEIWGP